MAKKKVVKSRKKPQLLEFKVSLIGTSPLVWRKFEAHDFILLGELHALIQVTMGQETAHLYEFEIDGKQFVPPDPDVGGEDIERLELRSILNGKTSFQYIYDFGDGWEHEVEITRVLKDDPRRRYPICTGGENACPPEDCGGIHGFATLKKTLAGPKSKAKDELLTWLGGFYDSKTFDPNMINRLFLWSDV